MNQVPLADLDRLIKMRRLNAVGGNAENVNRLNKMICELLALPCAADAYNAGKDESAVSKLKDLAAAYEAAKNYDYCPDSVEAATLPGVIITDFNEDNFRRGAAENEGRSPYEITDSIISAIAAL